MTTSSLRNQRTILAAAASLAAFIALALPIAARQTTPGGGPVIVLETVKGTIEIETFPEEAPKTVTQILDLVKRNFYNGLRFHRAEFSLIQVGDPQTRNMSMRDWWGRASSGHPIGASEITKKRRNLRGAVAMAYPGTDAKAADSQFYILTRPHPDFDGKYTVFGHVIKGMEVVDKIQVADILKRAFVRDPARP